MIEGATEFVGDTLGFEVLDDGWRKGEMGTRSLLVEGLCGVL